MFEDEETNRRSCDAAFSPFSMIILVFRIAECAMRQPFLVIQRHVVNEYLTEVVFDACLMEVVLLRQMRCNGGQGLRERWPEDSRHDFSIWWHNLSLSLDVDVVDDGNAVSR